MHRGESAGFPSNQTLQQLISLISSSSLVADVLIGVLQTLCPPGCMTGHHCFKADGRSGNRGAGGWLSCTGSGSAWCNCTFQMARKAKSLQVLCPVSRSTTWSHWLAHLKPREKEPVSDQLLQCLVKTKTCSFLRFKSTAALFRVTENYVRLHYLFFNCFYLFIGLYLTYCLPQWIHFCSFLGI